MLNRLRTIPLAKTYLFTVFVYIMLDSRYSLPYHELLRWIMPTFMILAVLMSDRKLSIPTQLSFILVVMWFLVACFQSKMFSYSFQRWISFCLIVIMHYSYYAYVRRWVRQDDIIWLMGLCYVVYGFLNFVFLDWGSDRMSGITGNPNSLGVWSVVSFLFASYYWWKSKGIIRLLMLSVMFFNVVTAILSGSRTYTVCILIDICYVIYISARNRQLRKLVVLLTCIAAPFLLFADNKLLLSIPGLSRLITEGIDRGYLWRYGIMLVREKPIWGHGYGISATLNLLEGMAFHNSYLTIAIETGIVGLALVMMSVISIITSELRIYSLHKNDSDAILLMLVLNMLLCFYGGSAMTSVGSTEGFFFWGLMMYIMAGKKVIREKYECN